MDNNLGTLDVGARVVINGSLGWALDPTVGYETYTTENYRFKIAQNTVFTIGFIPEGNDPLDSLQFGFDDGIGGNGIGGYINLANLAETSQVSSFETGTEETWWFGTSAWLLNDNDPRGFEIPNDPYSYSLVIQVGNASTDEDEIIGTPLVDFLNGDRPLKSINNRIDGLAGNDILNGLTGNDKLVGGDGSDLLDGGIGNDELTGVGPGFGVGEVDTLTGGIGRDIFVLGSQGNVYYNGGFAGLSAEQVKAIMPYAKPSIIQKYLKPLNDTMQEFEINTPARQAAFLAQVAVETGEFGARLPRKFRATEGMVENIAPDVANKNYAKLNGNKFPGDGYKYRGRGFIHLTGRGNYAKISKDLSLFQILVNNPDAVARNPVLAARTAGQFWRSGTRGKDLNLLADRSDFFGISRWVNGINRETKLPNGWKERQGYYNKSTNVLSQNLDNDYALITDFNPAEDKIQLAGVNVDYSLTSVSSGVTLRHRDELVALIQGDTQALALNAGYFQFG